MATRSFRRIPKARKKERGEKEKTLRGKELYKFYLKKQGAWGPI